jgi:uncharacterized protein (TIGR02246 family)
METSNQPEERAVRAILDGVYAAWAANDADAFVASYSPHATAALPGTFLRDRAAIQSTMKALFIGALKGSRAIHEVQSVRFLGPDLAVVINRGAALMAGQTKPSDDGWSWETWVLSKSSGGWQVEAFHNCPVKGA